MIKKYSLVFVALFCFGLSGSAQYAGTGTFTKITSLAELTDGYYVIANETDAFLMTNGRNGNANGGFFVSEVVTPVADEITNPSTSNVWLIETNGSGRTIYNEDILRYVGWISGNGASIEIAPANTNRWTFTYVDSKFTINNIATPVRQLSYNFSSPRFAAYGNDGQEELQLYKLSTPLGPSHTITFDSNGGSGTMPDQTIGDNTSANLNANTFTWTGYTFDSWNTITDGTGTAYADGEFFPMGTSDVTLYAQWVPYVGPCLSDNFNSDYGNWTGGSGTYNTLPAGYTGNGVGFNDNNDDIITSLSLTDPSTLSFIARASGGTSNYTINFQYSPSPTGPWTTITSIQANGSNTGDITTTFTPFNINLNLIGDFYLRILQLPRSGGSFYLDDVEVFCGTSTPEPELQLVDDTATNQNCGYTINFGTLGSNFGTRDLTFDIHNLGSADLEINSLSITGDYTIISPLATPFTITSGNAQTVTVQFAPTANGTRNGVLTIDSNDLDEGTCVVNLTGIGVTPSPEIDIERSTGSSIPNGALANTGYSTIFASTVMGNSTSPRTFYVSSEGTANLNLTSIVSSNPGEFPISLNPGATVLSPGTKVDFEITFSPTGVGTRTAIITIRSNDADEDPYTFQVQGNGACASGILTFLPTSGPVGSVVYVSSSTSQFGGLTSASVNGVSANVTVLSNNELEVTIPDGATTGSIEINDDLGCLSSEAFTVIDQLISDCEGSSGSTPSNLFISEVTDHGSGSHSFVEIFNGTGTAVDLTDYQIRIHNNGATTPTHTIPLIGTIANNAVFVLAFGAGDATNPHGSYTADQFSNATGINDNDHIRLFNSTTNTWIDLWGDISGDVFTIASKNYTYRRKNSGIVAPSTTWIESDWTSFTPVNYDDIGTYDFSVGTPPTIDIQPTLPPNTCDLSASISVTATEGVVGGNPLAYQWYFSAPGEMGWVAVTDGALYSGATTDTLTIIETLNLNDFQYYCEVREDSATCYTASHAVRLQVARTIWDGTNWTNATPPDINTITIINGDYNTATDGSFEACQLIINPGRTLVINDGNYVTVNFNVLNNGTLNIENNGSLVQIDDSGINTGNISMQRNTTIRRLDYVYWSSPVSGFNVNNISPGSPTNRIYRWHPTSTNANGSQGDWIVAAGETMQPGVGYIVRGPSSFTNTAAIYTATFNNGVPFNGVVQVDVSRGNLSGNEDDQWNLIGNPYPSAIDVFDFLEHPANSVLDGYVNLWTHGHDPSPTVTSPFYENFGFNYTEDDYIPYNALGAGNAPGNIFIGAGQSFMVNLDEASPANTVIEFNNSMRNSSYDNSLFYRSTERNYTTAEKHRIWLDLVSETLGVNRILVGYVDGATMERDRMYDARTSVKSSQLLYSLIGEEPFIIQGRSLPFVDTDAVPLGVNIVSQGTYDFAIAYIDGLFETENQIIYIKDNLLGLVHNLNETPYSFTSDIGEFNNRFELVFKDSFLSINEEEVSANNVSIIEFQNGDVQFTVPNNQEIKSVEIIDLLGRTIYKLKGNSSSETYDLSHLSQAPYIAKITLANGYVVSKKAVKRK